VQQKDNASHGSPKAVVPLATTPKSVKVDFNVTTTFAQPFTLALHALTTTNAPIIQMARNANAQLQVPEPAVDMVLN
jgi:hypothetical protein